MKNKNVIKIYYSSQYSSKELKSIKELVNFSKQNKVTLYFDTNICVYLRNIYFSPMVYQKNKDKYSHLLPFILDIKRNKLDINYFFGANEAVRSKDNFSIIPEKLSEMLLSLENTLNMDSLDYINHLKLIKKHHTFRDKTFLKNSKLFEYDQDKKIIIIYYYYLLELRRIELKSINGIDKFNLFLDLMYYKVDIVIPSIMAFAMHYFSGNDYIRSIIKPHKNNIKIELGNLWNAAYDLALVSLVSIQYAKTGSIPVFVTSDKKLFDLYETIKYKIGFLLRGVPQSGAAVFDYSKVKWSTNEISKIKTLSRKEQVMRFYEKMINNENDYDKLERLILDAQQSEKLYKQEFKNIYYSEKNV